MLSAHSITSHDAGGAEPAFALKITFRGCTGFELKLYIFPCRKNTYVVIMFPVVNRYYIPSRFSLKLSRLLIVLLTCFGLA